MNSLKQSLILFITALSAFALLLSCDTTSSSTDFESIIVTGQITDNQQNPLDNAIVRIINPLPEKVTTTNAAGNYSLELQVDSTITYTLEVRKEGFGTKTQDFLAIPERDVNLPAIRLAIANGEDGGDPPVHSGESGGPAYITLQSLSAENLQVRETGGVETAVFEFVVTDSTGIPVSQDNSVGVNFEIVSGPGGGESIYPPSVQTVNGSAKASLTSGTAAGSVQVRASFTRDGNTLHSKPVKLVIHGGLPSQAHFSVITEKINFPLIFGSEILFNALVGDRYGNNVPDGTAVYFTTDGGYIQGSGYTVNGRAAATLTVGNPIPANGIVTVTASTADNNQQKIETSTSRILSGAPQISVTPETFDIPNAEDQRFDYTVTDANGHPMVEGTTITVTVEGDAINLLGDVNITVGEVSSVFGNHDQQTNYIFIVDDANPDEINDTPVQITIEVMGPNGTARRSITGRKAKIMH